MQRNYRMNWLLFKNDVDFVQERSAASCVFLSSDVTMTSYSTAKVSVLVRYSTFSIQNIFNPKATMAILQ